MVFEEVLKLRGRIDGINRELLDLLSERASLVEQIGQVKMHAGVEKFDPSREAEEIEAVLAHNRGPFGDAVVRRLFTEIFRASLDLMLKQEQKALKVSRKHKRDNTVFEIRGVVFGGPEPVMVAGPCSVESEDQVRRVAAKLAELGVRVLRGGAVKPRSSPYAFQGLGAEGYRILRKVADEFNMVTVSEVMDIQSLQQADDYVDILQIGTRNMSNFRLLEAAREVGKPVLLKRGFAATYEELLLAAEYLIAGTDRIILCERGIRTFEPWTRNTLDISAVPILQMQSHLPVMVDVSHAAGRTDILVPLARAALAAGANGVMVEVHPAPAFALSDANQQLDLPGFEAFMAQVFGPRPT